MAEVGSEPQETRVVLFKHTSFLFSHQRRMEERRLRLKRRSSEILEPLGSRSLRRCFAFYEDKTNGCKEKWTVESSNTSRQKRQFDNSGMREGDTKRRQKKRAEPIKTDKPKQQLSCYTNPAELPAPGPKPNENMQSANGTE